MYRFRQPKPTACFDQCIHWDISPMEWATAKEAADKLDAQHQNDPTQRDMVSDKNLSGCLCEYCVGGWVGFTGLQYDASPLFDPNTNKDIGWDIRHDGCRDDVKGRWMDKEYQFVTRGTPFWVNIQQHEDKAGKIDYYVFAVADREREVIHIAGCMHYDDIEREGSRVEGKWPMYKLPAYKLTDYRKHIFHT